MKPFNPATPVLSIAQNWPHVKLVRAVQVGKGLKRHGSLGVLTGCGKVWRETLGDPDSAEFMIDCGPCRTALDKRNTDNRRTVYAVKRDEEQDAFAAGVPVADATAWRADWAKGNHSPDDAL